MQKGKGGNKSKTDNLEVPELQVDLKTMMGILQRGGKITRSSKDPKPQPPHKSPERHRSLLRYLGEPCLKTYLSNTTIKYRQCISQQYLINKKLKRLIKAHIPDNCIYFEKTSISQQKNYKLRPYRLSSKKTKNQQYCLQQISRPSITKNINIQEDTGILTAIQTLVFCCLEFEQFKTMFSPILADLKQSYKAHKIRQITRIAQQTQPKETDKEKIVQQQQQGPIDSEIKIPIPSVEQNQPQNQPNPVQSVHSSEQQILDIAKREIARLDKEMADLDLTIFRRLCRGDNDHILWPCIVLSPLVGQIQQIELMANRLMDISSKDIKTPQKILRSAYQQIIYQVEVEGIQQKFNQIDKTISKKVQNTYQLLDQKKQSKIILNFIGTHEIKVLTNHFIKWQDFEYSQIEYLLMTTSLRLLIDDINMYIQSLNKFKKLEQSDLDVKYSLFRLSKYQNENDQFDICIPLKIEKQKEDRKVLVRFFKDELPAQREFDLLKWVDANKLKSNFTLPRPTEAEKKFYYIMGNNISIEEGINYLYSEFYYKSCNFSQVLRICYPKSELRKVKTKEQRCIVCNYQIQNIPYYRCKFCLKFCHQQCASNRSNKYKPQSDCETAAPPIDIYETDNEEQIWNCDECSPCTQCQMAVQKDYIQCISCNNMYHSICGRLKGLTDTQFEQSPQDNKFTCQNCMKCRMCSTKLKNQYICFQGKNIFCVPCYKKYTKSQYCIVCIKQMPGQWVQCDQQHCNKWVHFTCDSYLKGKTNIRTLKESNYSCPYCRLKQRKKIIRSIIEELKFFDEYQYFYQPDYEELIGYKQAIKHPICIIQMREKAIDGFYDNNPYELIKGDIQLLVKNAMTFNMPKDEAHYRAKILLVVCTKFLQFFRDLIECNEEYLVNNDFQELFSAKKKEFYNELNQHYLEYLLNFRTDRGITKVKKNNNSPFQQEFFSSKLLINRSFVNAEFQFRVKNKPHKIQNLFTIPRLSTASWWPIRVKTCFYHPDQLNPIIYECNICFQIYCCTKRCLKHSKCSCGQKQCLCDSYLCKCPILKDKQKKALETKIHSTLIKSKLTKRQYTEYYKYCFKCVSQNLKTNWCYICEYFCYYAYQKCIQCSKIYHIDCQMKNRCEDLSVFFDCRNTYKTNYQNLRLGQMCYNCSYSQKYSNSIKEKLTMDIKSKASKLNTISKYLPIFNYLYEMNGIRITTHEIINLLYQNYQSFVIKQVQFSEFLLNFSIVIENLGNNRIAREEFRQYFMSQINRKLSTQTQHEKYISFIETKQMKELKQSKKFYKIFSKWFNNLYFPVNFINNYEIKYHLEHLTSKMSQNSNGTFGANQYYQISDNLIATNFKEENHLNYKNFERIKIQAITSYVSPKSKKNIYNTNKIEKLKTFLNFWDAYYKEKAKKIISQQQTANVKQYQKYLRFHSEHENLTDCIYKQQSSKSLLSQPCHFQHFIAFNQNGSNTKYNTLVSFKQHQSIYTNNKSEMLYKYLSNFALKIFQENKIVLKKGNTAILNQSKRCWRILKDIKQSSIQIKLEKKDASWILSIRQSNYVIKTIEEMIKKLRQVSPVVNTFQDVVQFMGFDITDSTFYEPAHFTNLLQTIPLDSLNKKQRKEQVLKVYNKYQWKRQGNFTYQEQKVQKDKNYKLKYDYNVTKKQIFYLKKKKNSNDTQQIVEPKVGPFITFDDIMKDIDETNGYNKQKDTLPSKEPTNDVYIAPSKIDRLGLFIRNFTKKNTIVVQYIGEIISQAMADIREQKFHFGCYMFGLGKNNTRSEIIDATFVGNMARYLNHSCDPNCKAKIEMSNGQPRILIYTIKDIKQNDQLTYDYQFKIDTNDRQPCKCKSKNCQGRLT